jgi:hypothetical protein
VLEIHCHDPVSLLSSQARRDDGQGVKGERWAVYVGSRTELVEVPAREHIAHSIHGAADLGKQDVYIQNCTRAGALVALVLRSDSDVSGGGGCGSRFRIRIVHGCERWSSAWHVFLPQQLALRKDRRQWN